MITECWTPQSSHRDTFFSIYLVSPSFWTSWSNLILTVTSTLLTNYCKHSIHPSLQANTFILPTSLSLSLQLARKQVHASTYYSNLLLLFFKANFKVTSKGTHLNQSTAQPHLTNYEA